MKNLILVFACFLLAGPALGQLSLGAGVGTNLSQWKWHLKNLDTDLEYDPALGNRIALTAGWRFSPAFNLRAEFGALTKARWSDVETNISGEYIETRLRERFHFWESCLLLEVSPLAKYKNLFFTAGFAHQYLKQIDLALEDDQAAILSPSSITNVEDYFYNRNMLAADFGIGGNIPISAAGKIKVEVRYQLGLNNVSTSSNVETGTGNLALNIGYLHQL